MSVLDMLDDVPPTAASAHPVAFPSRQTSDVPSRPPEVCIRRFISCQDCHDNPDARDTGSCTLTCHGVQHVNFTYQP